VRSGRVLEAYGSAFSATLRAAVPPPTVDELVARAGDRYVDGELNLEELERALADALGLDVVKVAPAHSPGRWRAGRARRGS
jgi:DNA-binding IclR family transcriptional regulator